MPSRRSAPANRSARSATVAKEARRVDSPSKVVTSLRPCTAWPWRRMWAMVSGKSCMVLSMNTEVNGAAPSPNWRHDRACWAPLCRQFAGVRSGGDDVEHPLDEVAGAAGDARALDGQAAEDGGAAPLDDGRQLLERLARINGVGAVNGAALALEHRQGPDATGS